MKLTDIQKHEVEILNTFALALGFKPSGEVLLRLYFALPGFTRKHGDYTLKDLAFALRSAKEVMKEERKNICASQK